MEQFSPWYLIIIFAFNILNILLVNSFIRIVIYKLRQIKHLNHFIYIFAYLFIESQVEYDLAEIYCIGMICVECVLR